MEEETHICPDCNTENPPGARFCNGCGRPLDLVGHMVESHLTDRRERIARQREGVSLLKEQVEQASQQRMEQWWQEENERRRRVAEAQARKRRQERLIVTAAIVGAAVLLGLILLITLLVNPPSGPVEATPVPIL
jgi:Flp pilus assembly protein TadB